MKYLVILFIAMTFVFADDKADKTGKIKDGEWVDYWKDLNDEHSKLKKIVDYKKIHDELGLRSYPRIFLQIQVAFLNYDNVENEKNFFKFEKKWATFKKVKKTFDKTVKNMKKSDRFNEEQSDFIEIIQKGINELYDDMKLSIKAHKSELSKNQKAAKKLGAQVKKVNKSSSKIKSSYTSKQAKKLKKLLPEVAKIRRKFLSLESLNKLEETAVSVRENRISQKYSKINETNFSACQDDIKKLLEEIYEWCGENS
ncbi:hypothetical protein [Candidatus Uabimicrobium sp. HlEnr_7]|uniref:hypothetical protein n=1 Tax=Candidatus Uabimicrobium helgolandensis TaxID=3095367 RepID=UPI003556FE06